MNIVFFIVNWFVYLFPIWAIILCSLALLFDGIFSWFLPEWIPYTLGFIMLLMGMTIREEDILRIRKNSFLILLGVCLQFTVMPLCGWVVAQGFSLSPEVASGLILVACCPGGTASNILCYLGKLDVALSVTMTMVSTILAVLLTPALSSFLIGSRVEVDGLGLFLSTIKIVLVPVVVGFILSKRFSNTTKKWENYFPFLSTLFVLLIVSSIVGSSRDWILRDFWNLSFSVLVTHSLGFFLGYVIAYILSKNSTIAKTISIEVGMQNSGLGVALAKENFSSPLVAVAPSLSSLFHSLIASILVGIWRLGGKNKSRESN